MFISARQPGRPGFGNDWLGRDGRSLDWDRAGDLAPEAGRALAMTDGIHIPEMPPGRPFRPGLPASTVFLLMIIFGIAGFEIGFHLTSDVTVLEICDDFNGGSL